MRYALLAAIKALQLSGQVSFSVADSGHYNFLPSFCRTVQVLSGCIGIVSEQPFSSPATQDFVLGSDLATAEHQHCCL